MAVPNKLAVALLLGLATEVVGTNLKLTWKDCGDSQTHVKVTALNPQELTLGQKTTIIGNGTADEGITGGKYTLTVKALGVTLLTHHGDFCKPDSIPLPLGTGTIGWHGESCPVTKGPNSLSMDVTLSAHIPPQLYATTIGLTGVATNGDKLVCVSIQTSKELSMTDPNALQDAAGSEDKFVVV